MQKYLHITVRLVSDKPLPMVLTAMHIYVPESRLVMTFNCSFVPVPSRKPPCPLNHEMFSSFGLLSMLQYKTIVSPSIMLELPSTLIDTRGLSWSVKKERASAIVKYYSIFFLRIRHLKLVSDKAIFIDNQTCFGEGFYVCRITLSWKTSRHIKYTSTKKKRIGPQK